MLLSVFAIYDSAVSSWMPPLYFRNKGECLRWYAETVNNSESRLAKHPGDFCLFECGSWNDESCAFDLFKVPVRLGLALEFIKS